MSPGGLRVVVRAGGCRAEHPPPTPAMTFPLTSSVSGIGLAQDPCSPGKQKRTHIFSEMSAAYFFAKGVSFFERTACRTQITVLSGRTGGPGICACLRIEEGSPQSRSRWPQPKIKIALPHFSTSKARPMWAKPGDNHMVSSLKAAQAILSLPGPAGIPRGTESCLSLMPAPTVGGRRSQQARWRWL